MFIGHYGPAIFGMDHARGLRLWHACLAVQAIDIMFCVLAILGLEGGTLEGAHPLAFNVPYSHSLVGGLLISFGVIALYRLLVPKAGIKGASLMGALAFSHWLFDLLVHRPDLPILLGGDNYVGLGLWNWPWAAFGLEVLLLMGMVVWWFKVTSGPRWTSFLAAALVVLLCAVQFGSIVQPTLQVQAGTFDPSTMPDPVMFGVSGLIFFIFVTVIIALIERKRSFKADHL